MNDTTLAVPLTQAQFDTIQAQYAEVHELKSRLEIVGRMSQQTLNMIVQDAGQDPAQYESMRLGRQDGKLLLLLYPPQKAE